MKIDHQGRVTIPKDLREYLGIKKGDDVVFARSPQAEENGRALVLWRLEDDEDERGE